MNRNSLAPGAVVTVDFPGATGIKRRPALVVSTLHYHRMRPDVIIAVLTSQVTAAKQPTDYALKAWESAGLRRPTAFRAYLATVPQSAVIVIGHIAEEDWREIQGRLQLAVAVS